MKHLGVCLQRLPREECFCRHQTSSRLRPTFHPEVAGACPSPSRPTPRTSQAARPAGTPVQGA